jgi:hypothetical protein
MQAVVHERVREHASVDALEEAVVRTTPKGFVVVVVWWRAAAGLCLCRAFALLLLLLSGQGSALRTENTAGGRFIA